MFKNDLVLNVAESLRSELNTTVNTSLNKKDNTSVINFRLNSTPMSVNFITDGSLVYAILWAGKGVDMRSIVLDTRAVKDVNKELPDSFCIEVTQELLSIIPGFSVNTNL